MGNSEDGACSTGGTYGGFPGRSLRLWLFARWWEVYSLQFTVQFTLYGSSREDEDQGMLEKEVGGDRRTHGADVCI